MLYRLRCNESMDSSQGQSKREEKKRWLPRAARLREKSPGLSGLRSEPTRAVIVEWFGMERMIEYTEMRDAACALPAAFSPPFTPQV